MFNPAASSALSFQSSSHAATKSIIPPPRAAQVPAIPPRILPEFMPSLYLLLRLLAGHLWHSSHFLPAFLFLEGRPRFALVRRPGLSLWSGFKAGPAGRPRPQFPSTVSLKWLACYFNGRLLGVVTQGAGLGPLPPGHGTRPRPGANLGWVSPVYCGFPPYTLRHSNTPYT